jgi:trehalose-phosphatase
MQPAEEYRDALRAAATSAELALLEVPGAFVEDNLYAISVHYRHVADADLPKVEAAVDRAIAEHPGLLKFPGKKVIEMRPDLEWNKGKAVEFILSHLEEDADGPVFPIYFGDDVSDEDAFKAVRSKGGIALLVRDGNVARSETAAAFRLRSPKQVLKFLSQLAASPKPPQP